MNTDKLMELERKWRDSAAGAKRYSTTEYEDGFAAGENACADELAAALRAEQEVGDEQLARELLAAELDAIRFPSMAAEIRDPESYHSLGQAMVRVVARALGTARQSEGVVLVPREPTEAMVSAMAECYDPTWGYPNASIGKEWAQKSYAAMLAAAPGGEGEG